MMDDQLGPNRAILSATGDPNFFGVTPGEFFLVEVNPHDSSVLDFYMRGMFVFHIDVSDIQHMLNKLVLQKQSSE